MKVLVTGVNGFIGNAISCRLISDKIYVIGSVRHKKLSKGVKQIRTIEVGEINDKTEWGEALQDIDTVIHLAGRVHKIRDLGKDPKELYERVNVDGTKKLVMQSIKKRVKRFIFLSTVKVNGEENKNPYKETDIPSPQDAYSISKYEAEINIKDITKTSEMEFVIIRPPLVYGPCVKANFLKLIRIVDRGIPLPFASIGNKRSMIYIENLVDAVLLCVQHPNAAGQTYLVSDGQDVSTPGLIRMIAAALQTKPRLFRCPPLALYMAGRFTGKGPTVDRLIGSLTVDTGKIKSELGWTAPFTLGEGLQKTAFWYKSIKGLNKYHLR